MFIYQFVEYFIDEYECVGIDNRIFTWKKKSNFGYSVDFFSKIYWIDLQRFLVKTET